MKRVLSQLLCLALLIVLLPSNNVHAATSYDPTKIVEYAINKIGNSATSGLCLKWVADAFKECYSATRYSSCCAANFGAKYLDSSGRDNIPLGADVFFAGGLDTCSSCGKACGHIGIYVGDGYIVHSWGGKVRKDTIAWIIGTNQKLTYYGWGWHGNMNFVSVPVTPVNTSNITSGTTYTVKNYASGKYITVPTTYNGSTNDVGQGHVLLNDASNGADQKIMFTASTNGAWTLKPQTTNSRIIETYMADSSRNYAIACLIQIH